MVGGPGGLVFELIIGSLDGAGRVHVVGGLDGTGPGIIRSLVGSLDAAAQDVLGPFARARDECGLTVHCWKRILGVRVQ